MLTCLYSQSNRQKREILLPLETVLFCLWWPWSRSLVLFPSYRGIYVVRDLKCLYCVFIWISHLSTVSVQHTVLCLRPSLCVSLVWEYISACLRGRAGACVYVCVGLWDLIITCKDTDWQTDRHTHARTHAHTHRHGKGGKMSHQILWITTYRSWQH